jgi:Fe-S-cluster-containing dehydrogenase component/DMSO reductase anchor subunit
MKRGFIFDPALCVSCKACSAACSVENSFTVEARTILSYNSEADLSLPLSNLSIACNHCETAVCMNGCPASAYLRESSSGALIIDDKKCIGCKYCIWNCPYDAPKYDPVNRVIGKCNLCNSRLKEGILPACTEGCPTGALSYGNIDDTDLSNRPQWFPGEELNPALRFKSKFSDIPLRIIPSYVFNETTRTFASEQKVTGPEWSLIFFTFLTALSVSLISLSLVNNHLADKMLFISLTLLPGMFSLFHLGKWYRAWRAVLNLRSSPLSREILLYIIYSLISILSIIFQLPWLLIAASLTGLLLLIAIDAVYIYSIRNFTAYLHSGQTFLTALIIISFLSGSILPFIFIAAIKLSLSVYRIDNKHTNRNILIIRNIRIALLIIAGAGIVSGISYPEAAVIILLIAGELLDRILFYLDFEPQVISFLINKHVAGKSYEKERD